MDTGTRSHPVRRRLQIVLKLVEAAALGSLLTLVVLGGLRTTSDAGAYARVVERATADVRCANDGTGPTALVRDDRGQVRVVSFRTGWEVFHGRLPGRLVAVCVEAHRTSSRHGPAGSR